MLRLPANLLVMEQAGVDAYLKRVDRSEGRYVRFHRHRLARPRHRRLDRALGARLPRRAQRRAIGGEASEYLGLGQNAPVSPPSGWSRRARRRRSGGIDCDWPLAAWNNPIAATELRTAQADHRRRAQRACVTGAAFTDTALLGARRSQPVPHPPFRDARAGDGAAARMPGAAGAADLVRRAEVGRAAHLPRDLRPAARRRSRDPLGLRHRRQGDRRGDARGGRHGRRRRSRSTGWCAPSSAPAARSVLASHWPLPDDYGATERLISGLFNAPPGTSIGEALRAGQRRADGRGRRPRIPYYWAGFAIVGDGAQPLVRK